MTKKFDFDLIVIGSGTAGSAAAISAAERGQNIAIVESGKWGGVSLNSRDLPFSSASSLTHLYLDAIRASKFGLSSRNLRYNYPTFQKWISLSKKRSGANSKKFFESKGITCLKGVAHFLSPYELSVSSVGVSAPKFIIATGAELSDGGILGLENVDHLTPETALTVSRLPKNLLVIGGGATGCELAEHFSILGSKVSLFELEKNLLPKEDEEAGIVLERYFTETLKIKVLTESRVVSVGKDDSSVRVNYLRGGLEKHADFDTILLATGSSPAIDIGLENAGVKTHSSGIIVDNFLQTSMKHIWAAGDCIGGESSSERSAYEGALSASNATSRQKNLVNYEGFIRSVHTSPEIASVGMSEKECNLKKKKYKKVFIPLSRISASNTSDFRIGFLKLLCDQSKKVIGATIMCPNAELIINELAISVRHKLSVVELASTPHISSSWSEIVRIAAKELTK